MRRVLLAIIMLVPFPAIAGVQSQLAAIDTKLKACVAQDSSNVWVGQCTRDAETAADKVLASTYKAFVDQLKRGGPDSDVSSDKETLKRLIASERAWIVFRDSDCELQGTEMLSGSGEGLDITECSLTRTKERAIRLDSFMNGK